MNSYGRARFFGGKTKDKLTQEKPDKTKTQPINIPEPNINKDAIRYRDAFNYNSIQQDSFIKRTQGIINCLPCSDAEKSELTQDLQLYNMKFPEYCQCHANETLDEDCPVDSWLASLYSITLAIRDNV